MKYIFIFFLLVNSLFVTPLLAKKSVYIGADVLTSINSLSQDDFGNESKSNVNSSAFKVKVGLAYDNGWRFQGYFLSEEYSKALFDTSQRVLNELGIDVIKSFEITPKFAPFIQSGLGYGLMSVSGYSEESIASIGMNIGTGITYKMTKKIELLVGVNLEYRMWEDILFGSAVVQTNQTAMKIHAGMNFHF